MLLKILIDFVHNDSTFLNLIYIVHVVKFHLYMFNVDGFLLEIVSHFSLEHLRATSGFSVHQIK